MDSHVSMSSCSSNCQHKDIVTVDWLSDNLSKVKVIDASWAVQKQDFEGQWLNSRIPGSSFFDIDAIATKTPDNLPHMLPSSSLFEQTMNKFGIGNADHVVIADRSGQYIASARLWWTFKTFGHQKVSVLEGGLLNWQQNKKPTHSGPPSPKVAPSTPYTAQFHPELVADFAQMMERVQEKVQIVDSRSAGRFTAADPEPRPGLRGGHMPGAKNVAFTEILLKQKESDPFFSLLPPEKLRLLFEQKGVDISKHVTTTCGSGITASILALALHQIGTPFSVYDGSWTEWGAKKYVPVAKGTSNNEELENPQQS